jgi:hypothetical protein
MRGYRTFPCPADPDELCGNAGWMPLYPLIIKGLRAGGVRTRRAAAIVSALATLATLVVLWVLQLASWPRRLGLPTLALAAVFPGVIYLHASFPISLLTLLCLVWLFGLVRDRTVTATVAAPMAAITYTTGFLLGPVTLGAGLLAFQREWRRWLVVTVATALGPLAVVVWQHHVVGTWDAFWQTQAKYGHGLHNPLATLAERLAPLQAGWSADPNAAIPAAQTLLVLVWVASLAVVALRSRATLDRGDVILLVFLALYWLVPLVAGRAALHRAESTLLISVLLARRLPLPALVAFVVASGMLAWAMGRLFFNSVLV